MGKRVILSLRYVHGGCISKSKIKTGKQPLHLGKITISSSQTNSEKDIVSFVPYVPVGCGALVKPSWQHWDTQRLT